MKTLVEIENEMIKTIIEKFRSDFVKQMSDQFDLTESELEYLKEFANTFSNLTLSLDTSNSVLYDIKTIFLAIIASTIKGPKHLFKLTSHVSSFMMPSGIELDLTKNILQKLKQGSTICDIQDFLKSMGQQKPLEQENLTNILDENGNRMTIEQLEDNFNKSN